MTTKAKQFVFAHCPKDGMLLRFPESRAGQRITCHGCGHAFVAPTRLFGVEEWRQCQYVELLMVYLKAVQSEPSPRKLRLLACAVCRNHWDHLDDDCRQALQVAERYADGMAGEEERAAAYANANAHVQRLRGPAVTPRENWACRLRAILAPNLGFHRDHLSPPPPPWPRPKEECALFREVVGDPFLSITPDPQWLVWNGGTVTKLAEAIYEERAFEGVPILADALEDAGCDDADILGHLREPGPHVRGCWALDLLAGKK